MSGLDKKRGDEERRRLRENIERDGYLEDVKAILKTKEGRRFVWKILEACGVYRSSMTGNSLTFFNEGKRDIGLQVLADVMDANPEAFLVMQREAKAAQKMKKEDV